MSAYLKFFELDQSPFEGKAQSQIVLGTRALRAACRSVQSGLEEGASRICLSGGAGLGKTSLARALPKLLGDQAKVALILDPTPSWESLRPHLARQWGLEGKRLSRAHLLEAARDQRLVLVIDQAEKASEEFLDHLDVVLSYRSESDTPVVQSVLLARLSGIEGESTAPILWWLDRIQTLQLEFAPLPREGVASYIHKHLKRAGWRGERLFSDDAAFAIHGYAGGVPGEISKLCERLLAEAAEEGLTQIEAEFVHAACDPNADEDDAWTLADEFEELALEDDFNDLIKHTGTDQREAPSAPSPESVASPTQHPLRRATDHITFTPTATENEPVAAAPAPPTPPLADTLEHFQSPPQRSEEPTGLNLFPDDDRAQHGAYDDEDDAEADEEERGGPEAQGPFIETAPAPEPEQRAAHASHEEDIHTDDPLWAPATEEELRAIRGNFITRHFRGFAAATITALVGGIGFALFSEPTLRETEEQTSTSARSALALDDRKTHILEVPSSPAKPSGMGANPQTLATPSPPRATEPAAGVPLMKPGGGFVQSVATTAPAKTALPSETRPVAEEAKKPLAPATTQAAAKGVEPTPTQESVIEVAAESSRAADPETESVESSAPPTAAPAPTVSKTPEATDVPRVADVDVETSTPLDPSASPSAEQNPTEPAQPASPGLPLDESSPGDPRPW